jgi:hypothetical protein
MNLLKLELQNKMERVAQFHQVCLDNGDLEIAQYYEIRYEQYKQELEALESQE